MAVGNICVGASAIQSIQLKPLKKSKGDTRVLELIAAKNRLRNKLAIEEISKRSDKKYYFFHISISERRQTL